MGQFVAKSKVTLRGVERGIYASLRGQIEGGLLEEGAKLVSTRAMAAELGVSRTSVTAAYEQLAAEGFVITSAGKAARVAPLINSPSATSPPPSEQKLSTRLSDYGQRVAAMASYRTTSPRAQIDFKYGSVASQDFPAQSWQRAYRRELVKRQSSLFYSQPEGEARLRLALQGYLRRARGLMCDAEQIVIVHGSQQGLDLCARLLLNPGDKFVFENPGYRMARYCFEATGATALPINVDAAGLKTDLLPKNAAARLAYVTPSHQFPTGAVLPIVRRQALLQWASRQRAWIIEDDYGGEFRYGQRPIDALQSMDGEGRVIYVGTFSKALSPQLRLGYLVVPRELVAVFRQAKLIADRHSARWEQNVLAALIEEGTYERHIRRLRRENERRRKALMEAVGQYLPEQGFLTGMAAGLHGVLLLPHFRPQDERALQAAALERGVGVYPLSPLFAESAQSEDSNPAGLILGYAGLSVEQIHDGVRILGEVLGYPCWAAPRPQETPTQVL